MMLNDGAVKVGDYLVVSRSNRDRLPACSCLVTRVGDDCLLAILDLPNDVRRNPVLSVPTLSEDGVPRIEFWRSATNTMAFSVDFPSMEGWHVFAVSNGIYTVSIAFAKD